MFEKIPLTLEEAVAMAPHHPPSPTFIASTAAIAWGAVRSGQSVWEYIIGMTQEFEAKLQAEYEAWKAANAWYRTPPEPVEPVTAPPTTLDTSTSSITAALEEVEAPLQPEETDTHTEHTEAQATTETEEMGTTTTASDVETAAAAEGLGTTAADEAEALLLAAESDASATEEAEEPLLATESDSKATEPDTTAAKSDTTAITVEPETPPLTTETKKRRAPDKSSKTSTKDANDTVKGAKDSTKDAQTGMKAAKDTGKVAKVTTRAAKDTGKVAKVTTKAAKEPTKAAKESKKASKASKDGIKASSNPSAKTAKPQPDTAGAVSKPTPEEAELILLIANLPNEADHAVYSTILATTDVTTLHSALESFIEKRKRIHRPRAAQMAFLKWLEENRSIDDTAATPVEMNTPNNEE